MPLNSSARPTARPRRQLALSAALAISPLAVLTTLAISCGGQTTATTLPDFDKTTGSVFRTTRAPRPELPTVDALLAEALEGVVDTDDETLGARMQLRRLRIPSPPRGSTASFDFEDGRRAWITALPSRTVLTSPAYGSGKVFLGGGFASHRFFAFDAFRGELEWGLAAPDGGPTAAIVDGDRVLFNTESCTLFVADVDTGELLWKRWLGDPLMSQPAVANDLVLSAYPKNGTHELGAFRLADGEPVWSLPIPADVIQAPQVVGDSVYFATMTGHAYRVRHRTGRVVWQKDLGASSAIWVDGDRALLSRRVDHRGRSFEEPVVLDADTGDVRSRGERVPAPYFGGNTRDRRLASGQAGAWGSVAGAHLGLANDASGWAFQGSSPAVADGRAYVAVGSELRAREIETGELVWKRTYGEGSDAQAVSPPAVIGSQLVYGTVDGHLYFSDIDTGMTIRAYDLGQPIVFQPIVAQGWVYVATGEGNLIGLEIGDAQLDGWHMWGGNPQHAGLVASAGEVDPAYLASLERPTRGTLRRAPHPDEGEVASDATDATDATDAGTETDEPELPLVRTRVEAEVQGIVARVRVTQAFENPHDEAIEGVYLFPLPENAAVDAMEMHIGERVVRGRIRRRQQARREYEAARAEGRRAALLEQQRPNLFVQKVANIPPGGSIDVQLEYVQTLPYADQRYELAFPMSAPPRYSPDDPGAVLDETARRAADRVDLNVKLHPGLPLVSVDSPTHEISARRIGDDAEVTLRETDATDRDFVLRYQVGGEHPEATIHAHRQRVAPELLTEPNGYFTLVVQPPVASDPAPQPREISFVIDRSSSMRGASMTRAKAVVREVLGGLRAEDRFSLYTFSDRVEAMSDAPVARTDETLAEAATFLSDVRAVGATEMVPAIQRALAIRSDDDVDRLRLVVLLTDGYIGNEADVLRAVSESLGDARLYALGVGDAVNRFLLTRAAEIGRGQALFSGSADTAGGVAARFASLVDRPVFTDVEIDWGGLDARDVYPRRTPDLFAGRPLLVHGRFERGGRARVRIRGTLNGERHERAFVVELPGAPTPGAEDSSRVHASLWARAAVRDRMNRIYLRDDPRLIEEVTQLGLRHDLVTQWTSFVAVDETPEAEAEPERQSTATMSPARSLPGDPEIRIPAPADARMVTVVLPFGESLAASWEAELDLWTARFLIPADAEEGSYPIDVLITHADGRFERMRIWYTVDAHAPVLEVETEGDVVPGGSVQLRATQVITEHDLEQVGHSRASLTDARAQLLADARRVEARLPDGSVIDLELRGPATWSAVLPVPADVGDSFTVQLAVVDMAANVRVQPLSLEVRR